MSCKFFRWLRQWPGTCCGVDPGAVPPFRAGVFVFLSVIIGTAGFAGQGYTADLIFKTDKKIIVIDPGHGGRDTGARGPDGALEKSVALKMARTLAARLDKHYRATLTRYADESVDILDRTAAANHLKADIFISIHAGGSFLHQTRGVTLFFYKNPDSGSLRPDARPAPVRWENLQHRHAAESRRLAQCIETGIQSQKTPFESRVETAPLLVLSGADMPAILIEIGYLTNPAEEKALQHEKNVTRLAEGIYRGIVVFFRQSGKLSGTRDNPAE